MPPSESPANPTLQAAVQTLVTTGTPTALAIEHLPLAVYREVAAHLQQLELFNVTLLPQSSKDFDYLQSQVGGIQLTPVNQSGQSIDMAPDMAPSVGDHLTAILEHYAQRFGPWQVLSQS